MANALTVKLETILVVDDNASVLTIVTDVLRKANFQVLSAQSGALAIELAKETAGIINLLLSDVDMPGSQAPT